MERIISMIGLLLAVLQVTAEDVYVKMTSLDEIDTESTYLIAYEGYIGKAFNGNLIASITANTWLNSTKTAFTIPDSYSSSGLLFLKLEVINANSNIYAIKIRDTDKYLTNPSSNYLKEADDYSSNRARWIIEKASEELNIKSVYNTNCYIKRKSSNDFCCTSGSSSGYKKASLYKKLPATETITIGDAGYITYLSSSSLDFTNQTEITPFIVTQSTNSAAILERVEMIPAKTPVVVCGTPGTYAVSVVTSADTVGDNLLIASDGTVKGDGETIYALGNLSAGVGFYLVDSDVVIPAGRCYLRIAGNSSSPSYIRLNMQEPTDIGILKSCEDDSCYYTLSGLRVILPHKGIYIYKGKKIVIK